MATPFPDPESTARRQVEEAFARMPEGHPRLFGGAAAFDRIRPAAAASPAAAALLDATLADADGMVSVAPVRHEKLGRRLLEQSRRALRRATTLGLAWRVTGRRRYADRLRGGLLAAAEFADWNPGCFLDTAEMALALAVGLDWTRDALSAADADAVLAALRDKGLAPARAGGEWATWGNNWNPVCLGGVAAGALVQPPAERDAAVEAVHRAVTHAPHAMRPGFGPDGAYPEGPMYWHYGAGYTVLLLAMLDACLGTDFGLSRLPGFDRTGDWLAAMTGPTGRSFNFGDGRERPSPARRAEPAPWWLARRFGRPDWLAGETRRWASDAGDFGAADPDPAAHSSFQWHRSPETSYGRLSPLALLWWTEPAPPAADGPSWRRFRGATPVAAYRSDPRDPAALYLAFKGGRAGDGHQHMDAGSFVLEADGVRWAVDLGLHDYHTLESRGVDLWSGGPGGGRWQVLRHQALAHSTLTIDGRPFAVDGRAEIVEFHPDSAAPRAVVDLAPALGDAVAAARRSFAVEPGARAVVVADVVAGLAPGARVRWGMATRARPRAWGGRTLVLEQDGRAFALAIEEPGGAGAPVWQPFDLARPPLAAEDPNPGAVMAAFEVAAPASGEVALRVRLAPASRDGFPRAPS